jgi:four helix bundle protein
VYQLSLDLVEMIYEDTGTFPKTERYGLSAQRQRASVSIPSSIAEGNSRRTAREYKHYTDIALGSLNEVFAQYMIAIRLGYLSAENEDRLVDVYQHLRAKLINYQKSIRTRTS